MISFIKSINCSIIIPVYYNGSSIKEIFTIIKEKVINCNSEKVFEIIFIDDGSGDNSFEELLKIKSSNQDLIKIIRFTRNFGQVAAIKAGYDISRGECMINISADIQDPPELINDMLASFYSDTDHYEIVICARKGRDENWYRRITSSIFYKIIKSLSFKEMPEGGFDFVLISRNVYNILDRTKEANPFLQGQILWTGYRCKIIEYNRQKRMNGGSKWTFLKKIKYLIDGVLSYSYFPIRIMSIFGLIIALLGFVYAVVIVFARIFGGVPFKGWAPIMVLILVLSGIQMLMLGIIGEYLWRTLDQVRNRPQFIIERIIE
jgi:dolichol-phosphate mannosyltransferase